MTRKELYDEIKKYNIAPLIRRERGNYTNLPNFVLEDYINIVKADLKKKTPYNKPISSPNKDVEKLKNAFVALVNKLSNYRIISPAHASDILNAL